LEAISEWGTGMKFVADSMLGRLAKWLRILGHDTCYQSCYSSDKIRLLVEENRLLLSRREATVCLYKSALLIKSDHVGDQLREANTKVPLFLGLNFVFSRCIRCNVLLEEAGAEVAEENIPEYVFYEHTRGVRFCPSCKRYYWPGTHRERVARQLQAWGLFG
jgi:uncharacterized protein with PIN domain